jgi:restriction endonuclease S subunit
MSEWKTCKLKDIVYSANTGLDAIRRAPIVEQNTGVKCLRIQDISQSKTFDKWGNTEVKPSDFEKYQLRQNDIIMARTCSTGICMFIQNDVNAVFNNGLVRVRANTTEVYAHYLYYLFLTKDFIGHIDGISGGTSVQLNMQIGDLLAYELMLPPLPEQQAIAAVLSSLDDKIDLLHRQNKTLEGMQAVLFIKLFVDRTDAKHYQGKLGDVVASANTGLDAIKRAPIVEKDTGIKCLRIQDISQSKDFDKWGFTEVTKQNFEKYQLKKDDIIMARTCSPGINYFVRENLNSVFNNGLVRIRADRSKVYPIFLFCLFRTREFIGHIDGISGGTSVQLNMQVGDLLDYDFSFPSISYQDKIVDQFLSLDSKILNNNKQIHTLSQLRDSLLPKLMSEEVRVKL